MFRCSGIRGRLTHLNGIATVWTGIFTANADDTMKSLHDMTEVELDRLELDPK